MVPYVTLIPQPTIASTTIQTIFTDDIFTTSSQEIGGDNISPLVRATNHK
jgi:hypothetical protein